MGLQSRQLILLISCLCLVAWSVGYFFIMMLLPKCQLSILNIIFIITIASMWALSALYFSKLLVCGASCCSWLYGILMGLGLLQIIIFIILGHDIISNYGIGFHGLCQTFTTIYFFGNVAILLLICGVAFFIKWLVSSPFDEIV